LALAILNELLIQMRKWGWIQSRREIEVHVLRSVTLYELGENEKALDSLIKALTLAEPGGYIRTFVDEGPAVAELLRRSISKGVMQEYASTVLNAFSQSDQSWKAKSPDKSSLLSKRELEVLRLIALGLSNPAIADHLFLAVGTVKAHTSSIYNKLDVENRVQAVARAQELNLI
jgi:LuxR family maltose regulon positive regulatory protein